MRSKNQNLDHQILFASVSMCWIRRMHTMSNVKLVNGIHPNSLTWDKPMTSAQAMRYWSTYGLIPAELYEADLRRQRHTISQLQAALLEYDTRMGDLNLYMQREYGDHM